MRALSSISRAPQLKGSATISAKPAVAALRAIELEPLSHSDVGVEAKLSSDQGRTLIALLGLEGIVAAGEGPAQFEGSVSGAWRAPLRVKASIWGAGFYANVDGSAEPGQERKANLNVRARSADLGPLLGLKPGDTLARDIRLASRVSACR